MKGDSTAAILVIVLIIVGIVALFLYFGNQSGFFLSFTPQPIVYNNDVISVSDKFISDRVPYEGQKTTIEFTVKNQGRGSMDGTKGKGPVEVVLDPPTGFTSSVKCGDKDSCKFSLEEGEVADVVITLTAISGITQIIPVDVRYSTSYPYTGEREIHIPIVSNRNELPRGQSYFVSEPTYGPIQISITPPATRTTPDGGSAIYAISGIPVKLDLRVENVGSGGFGSVRPVIMQGDDLKLTLTNFKTIFCDKIDPETNTLKIKEAEGGSELIFTGQQVPFEVSCTFEPTSSGSLADGVIKIDYKYVYRISFSDLFNILPRTVQKIEAPIPTSATTEVITTGGTREITGSGGSTIESAQNVGKVENSVVLKGSIKDTSEKVYHKYTLEFNTKYFIGVCDAKGGAGPLMKIGFMYNNQFLADRERVGCSGTDYIILDATSPTERILLVESDRGWTGDYELTITKKQESSS